MKRLTNRYGLAFCGTERCRVGLLVLSLFFIFLSACNNDVPVIENQSSRPKTKEVDLAKTNQMLAQKENTAIERFAERRGWKLTDIGSGIKMMKTEDGHGATADYDDTVVIRYTVKNIEDKVVYADMTDTIVIGRLLPNRGLDMALRNLNEGSRAWVMLPSDQAFGVLGDNDRIGTRWILIYDLEVVGVYNDKMKR